MSAPGAESVRLATVLLRSQATYWLERKEWTYCDAAERPIGLPLSARFLADIAVGWIAMGVSTGESRWFARLPSLMERIAERQDSCGAFRWNLPDPGATHPDGVRDQVDLAMVVDCVSLLLRYELLGPRQSRRARELIRRAADYLQTARLSECPGIIRKRDYETGGSLRWDVLNGDALAAKAFFLAARWTGSETDLEAVEPFLDHLQQRFGRHEPGWWPYAEHPVTREVHPPGDPVRSVFFQSMMIIHLRSLVRDARFQRYAPMVCEATDAIAAAINAVGQVIPGFESRHLCRGKPNVLIADALYDGYPALSLARLRRIGQDHFAATPGRVDITDVDGQPLDDQWRIWLFSDLARFLLHRVNGLPLQHVEGGGWTASMPGPATAGGGLRACTARPRG